MRHLITPRTRALFMGLTLALFAGHPVLADDTEIYTEASNVSTVRPNVLFVLDTSGSMGTTVPGTGMSRLNNMKAALDTILATTSNINVGLMRFHTYGGPVLWPVTNIDATVGSVLSPSDRKLRIGVAQSRDDATEVLSNGSVNVAFESLDMGDTLTLNRMVGLRFGTVNIPQGATITKASLEFAVHTPTGTQTVDTALTISAEASTDAQSFGAGSYALSSRPKLATTVAWSPDVWDNSAPSVETPGLQALVQELVDDDNWCGGNGMAFFVEGTGSRVAYAFDNSDDIEPTALKITYDATSIPADGGCVLRSTFAAITDGNDDVEETISNNKVSRGSSDLELVSDGSELQIVGLRFTGVDIPKNADIVDARISFTGEIESSDYTGPVSVSVRGEATDDAKEFKDKKKDVSKRSRTSAAVAWAVPNLANNQTIKTPNLQAVVSEITSRGGWNAGNDMVFMIDGSGRRNVRSANSGPGPVLQISYRGYEDAAGGAGSTLTVRDQMRQLVQDLNANGGTPIVDALYEASQYYRGDPVDYGRTRGGGGTNVSYSRVSHPSSYTGGSVYLPSGCDEDDLDDSDCRDETIQGSPRYISPMELSCQANYVVLLTDGEPTRLSSKAKIEAMIGAQNPDFAGCASYPDPEGVCGIELLDFIANNDQSSLVSGNQNVNTYTIGFNLGGNATAVKFNEDLAAAGDGRFYEADSAADLVGVFQNILADVVANSTSFNAPALSVNAFNRTSHDNDIYFSLFKPAGGPHWDGNLKKYMLAYLGDPGARELQIVDADGRLAVDGTGFFSDDARSDWTTGPADGGDVTRGGARNRLTANRLIYAPLGGVLQFLDETDAGVVAAVSPLWPDLFGTEVIDMLRWIRGTNPNGSARQVMGDPLHSKPVVVTYGGTSDSPDTTVFIGTNDGYLHAFDGETGVEQFAFVPVDMLARMPELRDDAGPDKFYGIDGEITVERTVDGYIYLYFGLRRGGDAYYALDVTDRNAPKLRWARSSAATGFSKLGATWSKPALAKISDNGTERSVLFVGGGYDNDQDDPDYSADSVGNAIYMLDTVTGNVLWSASDSSATLNLADMVNSIPASVRVLDLTGDGLADRLYAGDMGGRLWRFDIHNGNAIGGSEPFITGGKIASLGAGDLATPSVSDNRRFYYAPDVALVRSDYGDYLNISIGSGYRAHPLNKATNDAFYAIFDPNVVDMPPLVDTSDPYSFDYDYGIVDKTNPSAGETSVVDLTNPATLLPNGARGWKIDLVTPGEKVLAEARTFQGHIFFNTYTPGVVNSNPCAPAVGQARSYIVDMKGAAVRDTRGTDLDQGTIPSEPVFVFPPPDDLPPDPDPDPDPDPQPDPDDDSGDGDVEDGRGGADVACFIGPERCPVDLMNTPQRTYWTRDNVG